MQSLEITVPLDDSAHGDSAPAEPARTAVSVKSFDGSAPVLPSRHCRWKPWFERMLAAVLLIPGAPMIAVLVVLVRATSRGKGIYSQVRVGKDGREYTMYKIRTMACDAESQSGPVWNSGEGDPRVTKVGRWLRKLHMDELPQLWNVLRGEMLLIGPRPERPEFVRILSKTIPNYRERLLIAPGITGLAQINLPPDTCLDSVRRKLVLDREYIASATAALDLRILASTALRMFGVPGTAAMRLLRLERTVVLPPAEISEPADESLPHVFSEQPASVKSSTRNGASHARAPQLAPAPAELHGATMPAAHGGYSRKPR